MIMPLVASLLAPVMLAASTFTNVVGTLNGESWNEDDTDIVPASAAIAVPSDDFNGVDLGSGSPTVHLRLGSLSLDYSGQDVFCLFVSGTSSLTASVVPPEDLEAEGFYNVYPCVLVEQEFNANAEVTINLPLSAVYSSEENEYGLYIVYTDEEFGYIPFLPAGSYTYDDGTVAFDVDALTSTVDANDVISAITGGLDVVPHLGGSLNDGFDAIFMNNGTLTVVGLFAFVLMGLGIGVGVVKKVLNWITGRHGM